MDKVQGTENAVVGLVGPPPPPKDVNHEPTMPCAEQVCDSRPVRVWHDQSQDNATGRSICPYFYIIKLYFVSCHEQGRGGVVRDTESFFFVQEVPDHFQTLTFFLFQPPYFLSEFTGGGGGPILFQI